MLHTAKLSEKKFINENLIFEKNQEKGFWYLVLRDVVMGELRALVAIVVEPNSQ